MSDLTYDARVHRVACGIAEHTCEPDGVDERQWCLTHGFYEQEGTWPCWAAQDAAQAIIGASWAIFGTDAGYGEGWRDGRRAALGLEEDQA